MIDGSAAGHTFKNGACDCGARLVDLQHMTETDVGKPGIAHAGTLTNLELAQIKELVAKMRSKVNVVFGWRD
jgi:hypothetical protein